MPSEFWSLIEMVLLPVIAGIIWWLAVLDARQYRHQEKRLEDKIAAVETFVNKADLKETIARLEEQIKAGNETTHRDFQNLGEQIRAVFPPPPQS